MSNLITEEQHEKLIARATELGKEHGTSAGSWVTIEDRYVAARLIRLADDGDPAWDDAVGYTGPLSGEWADSLTPDGLFRELDAPPMDDGEEHDILTAYEQEHFDSHRDEVLRRAQYQLD